MAHTGWLDSASFTRVSGWANVPVAIHVNGELAATAEPTIRRPDLDAGCFGFAAFIDPLRFHRGENEVKVTFAENGVPIGNGEKKLELPVSPELISGYSLASVERGFWTPLNISKVDDRVTLTGWCVSPPGVESARVFSDGEDLHFSSHHDAQLQAQTWLPPETPVHQFEAEFRFRKQDALRLSFGAHGRAFNPDHDCMIPRDLSLQPGRERVRRVAGGFDALKFDVQGLSIAERLRHVLPRFSHAPLAQARVLDWGVGAGRVARFLAPHVGAFSGVDVDADNLAWCRENLRGEYLHIATDPPTPLEARQFDFIYGISVVTHLTRDYEQKWLGELRRLVKDDGVVALSIHGPTALMVMGLCHAHVQLAAEGFVDLGENKILAGRVPDGYYRNVAHSFAHLHRVWSEFFTIADIIPGGIGIQDLVVLRPRSST